MLMTQLDLGPLFYRTVSLVNCLLYVLLWPAPAARIKRQLKYYCSLWQRETIRVKDSDKDGDGDKEAGADRIAD